MKTVSRVIVLLGASALLPAQTDKPFGTWKGDVTLNSKRIANAQIEATEIDSRRAYQATTDAEGNFTLQDLPIGKYSFLVTINGQPTGPPGPVELKGGVQYIDLPVKRIVLSPPKLNPIAPPPQFVSDAPLRLANKSPATITLTAFGILILSLKDRSIVPGGYTTLSLEFRPFTFEGKSLPNDTLFVSASPFGLAHLKALTLEPSPPGLTGDRTFSWQLTASDDFSGSEVGLSVTIEHRPSKGAPKKTPPVNPKLRLDRIEKPTFSEKFKDIIGPVSAAFITGVFGIFVGIISTKHGKTGRKHGKK